MVRERMMGKIDVWTARPMTVVQFHNKDRTAQLHMGVTASGTDIWLDVAVYRPSSFTKFRGNHEVVPELARQLGISEAEAHAFGGAGLLV